jgi:hypothetical protein
MPFLFIILLVVLLMGGAFLSKKVQMKMNQRTLSKEIDTEIDILFNTLLTLKEQLTGVEYALFEELEMLKSEKKYEEFLGLSFSLADEVYALASSENEILIQTLSGSILDQTQAIYQKIELIDNSKKTRAGDTD